MVYSAIDETPSLFHQGIIRPPLDAALTTLLRYVHEAQPLLHAAPDATLALLALAGLGSLAAARCAPEARLAHVGLTGIVRCGEHR